MNLKYLARIAKKQRNKWDELQENPHFVSAKCRPTTREMILEVYIDSTIHRWTECEKDTKLLEEIIKPTKPTNKAILWFNTTYNKHEMWDGKNILNIRVIHIERETTYTMTKMRAVIDWPVNWEMFK